LDQAVTERSVEFISTWQDTEAYTQLKGNRSVHNAQAMMHGWGEMQGFEAAVGKKNMVDASLLELLANYRRAVCKITCSGVDFRGLDTQWSGTGFLVGPNLLVTNNHVLNTEAVTASAVVDFEYERGPGDLLSQKPVTRTPKRSLQLDPSRLFLTDPAVGGLDFTFVWIGEEAARDYGYIPMSRASFAGRVFDPVFIIHHPNGELKQVSLDDTELLNVEKVLLLYAADTEGGSSGAPVITRNGKLCGLHHAFRKDEGLINKHSNRAATLQDGKSYRVANEGIQFSAIAVKLETELTREVANEANIREVLRHFVDTDTVTGPYGVRGRRLVPYNNAGAENSVEPQGQQDGLNSVIKAVDATNQDVDVAVWNMSWLNQYKSDGTTLRRAASVFADVTQDVWVLDSISRETADALRTELEGIFAQEFAFAFADDESHPALPMTALFYNTRALKVTRDPWPSHVEALWRVRAQDDLQLKTLSGPVFPSFPARFNIEVLGRTLPFSFRLVPFFLGEHSNIQMRKAVAAKIMSFIIGKMVVRSDDISGDWLIAGDVNAPMRRARAKVFEAADFDPIFLRDPERGGFSYLRSKHTILSQIFVPEKTQLMGSDDGAVTTVPHVFQERYVDDLTSKAPYGIRISLMNEESIYDLQKTIEFLGKLKDKAQGLSSTESNSAEWRWRGLSKQGFMRVNESALAALLARVNNHLVSEYGPTALALTMLDLYVLIYCEAGYRNGHMDPFANHSLGERGLLPLPDNLPFWLGRALQPNDETLPLQRNVGLYAEYLGQLKNKAVRKSSEGLLYRDLFEKAGIAGNVTRQARLLAGIVHGYFLAINYCNSHMPEISDLLAAYGEDVPIQDMLAGTGYVHDGTMILRNRQDNIDTAETDYYAATVSDQPHASGTF
jgi:hypothetical protein